MPIANSDIKDTIDSEGFDYFFAQYINLDDYEDRAWYDAAIAYYNARLDLIEALENDGINMDDYL